MKNSNQKYLWYALKKNINTEDAIAKSILQHVVTYGMQDKIADVRVLKNYQIVEEDFAPNSDLLPKKLFRNSKKNHWIRLKNGHYKKVKIVEEKPFKGLIFLKLAVDPTQNNNWLFQKIINWAPGTMFLGQKNCPESINETAFNQMSKQFINQEIPDLQKYLIEKELITSEQENISIKPQEPTNINSQQDWTAFDVVKKAEFDLLFQNDHDQETNKRGHELGVISVHQDLPEPKITPKENWDKLQKTTKLPPKTKPPIIKPGVDNSQTKTPINFQVGDIAWSNNLQTEVEIKEIRHQERKLVVEFEIFNRAQTINVDPEDLKKIS